MSIRTATSPKNGIQPSTHHHPYPCTRFTFTPTSFNQAKTCYRCHMTYQTFLVTHIYAHFSQYLVGTIIRCTSLMLRAYSRRHVHLLLVHFLQRSPHNGRRVSAVYKGTMKHIRSRLLIGCDIVLQHIIHNILYEDSNTSTLCLSGAP